MPRKATELKPANECSECGGPVQSRRPSKSGAHFCSKTACQNAKVAFYRNAKAHAAEKSTMVVTRELNEIIDNHATLIVALMGGGRVRCPLCGLTNAITGFKHPSRDGAACWGTGDRTVRASAVFAIWPQGAGEYVDPA